MLVREILPSAINACTLKQENIFLLKKRQKGGFSAASAAGNTAKERIGARVKTK